MSDLPPAGPLQQTDTFAVCQQVPCPAGTQFGAAQVGQLSDEYSVTRYGAVGDGVTDDHVAIQAAINAAGAKGAGNVTFPPKTFYLGTGAIGIQVGTGGDGAYSSYGSVVLVGKGGPGSIYAMPSGVPRLTYAGDGAAVKFAGPLQGWGVRHLRIDCAKTSPSSIGLLFVSSSYGISQDFAVQNCFQDMLGTTVNITPTGGTVGQANTNNNVFSGFQLMIGEGVAPPTGLIALHLSGGSSGGVVTGDSFFNTFDNGLIEGCASNGITENGIYLDIADSNRFKDVLIATCTGPATFRSIVVDWSVPVSSGYFPAADIFDRVDTNPTRAGTVSYTFLGTPQPVAQEWFTNITTTNGDFYPPIQPGVYTDHSLGSWTPTLQGSSSAGTPTYVNQAGNYTSSGYAIAAYFVVEASSLGGAAGNLQIGGLPVPMSTSTVVNASCALSLTQGWNSAVSGVSQVTGQIANGQSVVGLNEIGNNANATSPVASWHTSPTTVKIVGLCNYPRREGLMAILCLDV